MKKIMLPKNQAKLGFSLVEILIAVSLVAIIGVGLSSVITSAAKQQKGIQAKDQQREITAEIRNLMSDKLACANSFNGQNPQLGFSVNNLQDGTVTPGVAKFSVGTNDKTGLLKFDEFVVGDWAVDAASPITGNAVLKVKLSKVGDTGTVVNLRPDLIMLKVKRDGTGNIIECYSMGSMADSFWKPNPAQTADIYYSGGRVGIGTQAPATTLEINVDQDAATTVRLTNNSTGTNSLAQYEFSNGTGTGAFGVRSGSTWGDINQNDTYVYGNKDLVLGSTGTANSIRIVSGPGMNELMRILPNGNLGVGTTNPEWPIQIIKSDSNAIVEIVNTSSTSGSHWTGYNVKNYMGSLSGYPKLSFYNNRGNSIAPGTLNAGDSLGVIEFLGAFDIFGGYSRGAEIMSIAEENFNSSNSGGANLRFATANIGTGLSTEKMRIAANGNVGIGTTTPLSKLAIDSSVAGGAGADFISVIKLASSVNADIISPFNGSANFTPGLTGAFQYGTQPMSSSWVISKMAVGENTWTNVFTVKTNGHVGIGTLNPVYQLHASDNASAGYSGISLENTAAGGGLWNWLVGSNGAPLGPNAMCFETGGTCQLSLYTSGNVTITGVLTQNSDQRLKKDILRIPNSLESISKLEGVTYNWIDSNRSAGLQMGLVAQDVEKVFPEVVKTDSSGFKSVAYQNLIAPVVNAIHELRNWLLLSDSKIFRLEHAVAQLEANKQSQDQKIKDLELRIIKIEKNIH